MPALAPVRVPRGKPGVERLAAAAAGIAQAAAPYAARFVDAGLRADFVERLSAAADGMLAAVGERGRHHMRRRGATAGIRATLVAGRRAVSVLDALIASAWAAEPALLAGWRAATRVRRAPARGTASEPGASEAVAPSVDAAERAVLPDSPRRTPRPAGERPHRRVGGEARRPARQVAGELRQLVLHAVAHPDPLRRVGDALRALGRRTPTGET